jgi:hypothetical protein
MHVKTRFIPETNKHQTQKKNVCTSPLKYTRTTQYISAASNAFSHAYIAFQHTLSYSKSDTNNQKCERREDKRERRKKICERNVNEKKRT